MDLHEKTCVPCRGGVPPLGPEEAARLAVGIPEWRLDDDAKRLMREFKFGNFAAALAFVDAIGAIAEAEQHHPDICFGWGYAKISLWTHKIDGLHENDFIMAAKFDQALGTP
jgi:4a-hydroxytetrahydrobiopterin dehydratase